MMKTEAGEGARDTLGVLATVNRRIAWMSISLDVDYRD